VLAMIDDLEDFEYAVGDRFGRIFPRWRTTRLATPRELVDYVTARSAPSPDLRSVKQHAFYFIRTLIARELRVNPQQVSPTVVLAHLMPEPAQRRDDWKRISRELRVPLLPQLSRPSSVQWAITLTVAVLSYAVFLLAAFALEGSAVSILVGAVFAAGMCALLFRITERFATEFLPPTLTVGDLAAYATAYGSKNPALAVKPSSRSQNLEVVRDLVRLEIGATRINEDATWEELHVSARSAP
jgi:hypothetical protein